MKTIIMIGDSFGVPNYAGPPGIAPEKHVEYLLKDLGYEVINLSTNNSLNETHLNLLDMFLSSNPFKKIDFVVWFHNCAMHLIGPMLQIFTIDSQQQEYLINTYNKAVNLKLKTKAKWFVIGGSSPIPDFFYNYKIHDGIIPDWRSQILNEDLPNVPGWRSSQNQIVLEDSNNRDTREFKQQLIKDFDYINQRLRREKTLFPDNSHPGERPHQDLAHTLSIFFN